MLCITNKLWDKTLLAGDDVFFRYVSEFDFEKLKPPLYHIICR